MKRDFGKFGMQEEERILFTPEVKRVALNHSNQKCASCGKHLTIKTMTTEHVIPLSRGGSNNTDNLVALCESCNKAKDDKFFFPSDIYVSLNNGMLRKLDEAAGEWFFRFNNKLDLSKYPLISPEVVLAVRYENLNPGKLKNVPTATCLRVSRCGNKEAREVMIQYYDKDEYKSTELDATSVYKITTMSGVLKEYIFIDHFIDRSNVHGFNLHGFQSTFSSIMEWAVFNTLVRKILERYRFCKFIIGEICVSFSDNKRTEFLYTHPLYIDEPVMHAMRDWVRTREERKCVSYRFDSAMDYKGELNRKCLELYNKEHGNQKEQ